MNYNSWQKWKRVKVFNLNPFADQILNLILLFNYLFNGSHTTWCCE
jgi:hypothetical protein